MNTGKPDSDILSSESIKAIITHEDVKNILLEDFGLHSSEIKDLNGYDDKNFQVKVTSLGDNCYIDIIKDDGYILKVINTLDSKKAEFFRAQDCVLVYLGNRKVCCPKPVKAKTGRYMTTKKLISGEHVVRLLEFIPGNILVETDCSPLLCYECGAFVANLNYTLKDFKHKGYEDRNIIWMMSNVPKLNEFLFVVKDTQKQRMVKEVIEAFSSRVLPKSDHFESGLIHGDFNEQNILIEQRNGSWHVKGVLDFGDSHIGCFLYDLAISMTYMIIHAKDLECGGYVLAGYKSVRSLPSDEIQLLKICVCARMCQSLVLGAFTASRDSGNTYVTRTAQYGWQMLDKLWNIPDEVIIKQWLTICDDFNPN